ncbi:MAG: hypothetical protein ABSF98_20430 [Bryobacteraceae bacterium]
MIAASGNQMTPRQTVGAAPSTVWYAGSGALHSHSRVSFHFRERLHERL